MHNFRNLNIMKFVSIFLVIFMFFNPSNVFAGVTKHSSPLLSYQEPAPFDLDSEGIEAFIEWILEELLTFILSIFNSCQEVPTFSGFTNGSMSLSLNNTGQWKTTGATVTSGKMLKINWTTQSIAANPRQYYVMYRIDPRFARPQLFILQYDYLKNSYISDFHTYNNLVLPTYQSVPKPSGQDFNNRVTDYENYFNFIGNRTPININPGDVISISLVDKNTFFTQLPVFVNASDLNTFKASPLIKELDAGDLMSIYTSTGLPDNAVLYMDAVTWCESGGKNSVAPYNTCSTGGAPNNPSAYTYNALYYSVVGLLQMDHNITNSLPSCPAGSKGPNFQTPKFTPGNNKYTYGACLFDGGRTMPITVGGTIIKDVYTPFTYSNTLSNYFFSYKSQGGGKLDFVDPNNTIPTGVMFNDFDPLMSDWARKYGASDNIVSANALTTTNILYGGRYLMNILVGSGSVGSFDQQNDIQIEYIIMPNNAQGALQVPNNNTKGTPISQIYTTDASTSGVLWLRVINPNTEVSGSVNVGYSYYTGSTFLSDTLYGLVVKPVLDMILNTSKLFYSALATNPEFQWIVRLLLTFYLMHKTARFLVGEVQITLNSLLEDILRITVIIAMMSDKSWSFFYNNAFQVFLGGMSYLFNDIVGLASASANPFGFVDVIFDKYTDSKLWVLLLAELVSFTNGLTLVSIVVIGSIISFLGLTLDIVIAYVFAYVVIASLISFAPLFIICMLFERTRGIFDNWISLMFNYMIQPTVLLLFFLLLDQLMTSQLALVLVRACWGYLIEFGIYLDMNWCDLGTWNIPLGAGIPGLIPQTSSNVVPGPSTASYGTFMGIMMACLMFSIYSQIAQGLMGYVNQIVTTITGSAPITGKGGKDPVGNIKGELKAGAKKVGKVAAAPVKAIGRELKEKLWDGKVKTKRPGSEDKEGGEGKSGDDKLKQGDFHSSAPKTGGVK